MDRLNYKDACKLFSQERIDSYAECFPNRLCTDEEKVKKYYENIEYCQKLWKDVCLIEIAIRNKLIEQLEYFFKDWYTTGFLPHSNTYSSKFPKNNSLQKYTKSTKYIESIIMDFKKSNCIDMKSNEQKDVFISRQTFGFFVNIPILLKYHGIKRWDDKKYFGINNNLLYMFKKLRNMLAHHENLLKHNKKN